MSDIIPSAPGPNGPQRLLILDATDPAGARWLIAAVTLAEDVRPADLEPGGRRYRDWPAVTAWVRERIGRQVSLTPIAALVWRVGEGRLHRGNPEL
jgi:hypothetical protein